MENVYKTIIADYYEGLAPSLTQYITKMVRNVTRNANLDNIHKFLKEFDHVKKETFKHRVQALANSNQIPWEFSDLADARNKLAYGNPVNLSFNEIKKKVYLIRQNHGRIGFNDGMRLGVIKVLIC